MLTAVVDSRSRPRAGRLWPPCEHETLPTWPMGKSAKGGNVSATDGRLRPPHPLDQMTTSELAAYRAVLEAALDAVLKEQAEREQIRHSP